MTFTPVIRFGVDGVPKAQPRPRAFARKFANGQVAARVYDAGTAEGWKSLIAEAARPHRPAQPLEGAIRLDADFYFPRPKALCRKCDPEDEILHTVKPDRDNLEKSLLDCLKTIGVLKDDCQVCCGEVRKFYVRKGGRPGALVGIGIPEGAPSYGQELRSTFGTFDRATTDERVAFAPARPAELFAGGAR